MPSDLWMVMRAAGVDVDVILSYKVPGLMLFMGVRNRKHGVRCKCVVGVSLPCSCVEVKRNMHW